MRVKTKFKAIWTKPIQRRLVGLRPFPGASLLRWVVLSHRSTPLYEGKPSTQALRIAAGSEKANYVIEFDKEAPFCALVVQPGGAFQFGQVDWPTWERFHGKKDAVEHYKRLFGGQAGAAI